MDVPAVPNAETNDLDLLVVVVVFSCAGCFGFVLSSMEDSAGAARVLAAVAFVDGAAMEALVLCGAEFLAAGRSPNRSSIVSLLCLMIALDFCQHNTRR